MTTPAWLTVFPLIRRIAQPLVPWCARAPLTPNQITTLSLLTGLGAACLLAFQCNWQGQFCAAILFFLSYLFDHLDGPVARLKNMKSRFGYHYDTFVDWLVNAAFFLGLGWGWAGVTGEALWLWLGAAAFGGATLNYAMALLRERRGGGTSSDASDPGPPDLHGRGDLLLFVFREVSRADFWAIVILLACLGYLWLLLPLGAMGAQVYWLTAMLKRAQQFHI